MAINGLDFGTVFGMLNPINWLNGKNATVATNIASGGKCNNDANFENTEWLYSAGGGIGGLLLGNAIGNKIGGGFGKFVGGIVGAWAGCTLVPRAGKAWAMACDNEAERNRLEAQDGKVGTDNKNIVSRFAANFAADKAVYSGVDGFSDVKSKDDVQADV